MKKFLTAFLILNILTLLGVVGFLMATGRVDREKTLTILDILKHRGTPVGLRDQTHEILTSAKIEGASDNASTQPATAPANPGSAADRLEFARLSLESERLKLENEARELRHRQELLDATQADISAKLARVEQERKAFEQRVQEASGKAVDDAFNRSLTLYQELKPKQIKDIFTGFSGQSGVDLVARYLLAMDSERAGKIISEFKTPEEKAFITSVLEKIRTATPAGVPAASTGAPAAPLPVQARS